jgi:hypothetical protein
MDGNISEVESCDINNEIGDNKEFGHKSGTSNCEQSVSDSSCQWVV